ncbi:peptidoglycan-binding protein [Bovifimicola ammoniilytica]|uniref:peptidoglycan-binding protein n=1 Tax=Bovifimicola ammoniilytica TaxID=2981720 RepID=UPI0008211B93|nr:peptidoglycan-binding protein [Bovifimicola ammoniilytica]SCJ39604.1 SpoIID/LytB domain [uncultured Eubacterium sp.]
MRTMQNDMIDRGQLQVNVTTINNIPIENVNISIYEEGQPTNKIEEITTDASGQSEKIDLATPPVELSLYVDNIIQPYAEYSLLMEADGYEPVNISGVEILSGRMSIQDIKLRPLLEGENGEDFVIPAHTLYGEYPPKIAEAEVKPVNPPGEIVLSRVVIPEYIIVHDGAPSDSTASDYYVLYKDYIKNVASSEIYATWPEETIKANVLAIMSFTLNRVYTEWYRNKGYDFTITSSTAFDHKWINNRNIFDTISLVVDEIFDQYLSRPNVKQPILTQYCDGNRVSCPGWMTQWGSKSLGESGYSAIQILRNFYGSSIYINTAEQISGVPISYPGYELDIGASGSKVQQIQEELDRIAQVYSNIPRIQADGIYGEATKAAVKEFQRTFDLPQTGIIDFRTWYKISQIYVGITRIAELNQ